MKNNENQNTINYIQLPLKVFLKRCPEIAKMLPPLMNFDDDNYIVRLKEGRIEIGYTEDAWNIC